MHSLQKFSESEIAIEPANNGYILLEKTYGDAQFLIIPPFESRCNGDPRLGCKTPKQNLPTR